MNVSSIVVKVPPKTVTATKLSNCDRPVPMMDISAAPVVNNVGGSRTNVLVSYHREQKTGDLTQTRVLSNDNHVTVRSVNSPQDVTCSFDQDVNRHQNPRTAVARHTGYEYSQTPVRSVDPASGTEGQHIMPGTVLQHKSGSRTVYGNDVYSAKYRPLEVKYQDKSLYHFGFESSRSHMSPPSLPRMWEKKPEFESSGSFPSTTLPYTNSSGYNIRESEVSPPVELSSDGHAAHGPLVMNPTGKSCSDKTGRNFVYPPREVIGEPNEFTMERRPGGHDVPSMFLAIPVNARQTEKKGNNVMEGNKRSHECAGKPVYLLPRPRSVSYSNGRRLAVEFLYSNPDRKYQHDHGDVTYAGDDKRLYSKKKNITYLHDDSAMLYFPLHRVNGTEMVYTFDDLSLISASDEEDYSTGKSQLKGPSRNRLHIDRRHGRRSSALSQSDFQQTIPVYTHRRYRNELSGASSRHEKSRERRQRHIKDEQASPSSYSDDVFDNDDDDDDNHTNSRKKPSRGKSRHQIRQRKPDVFSENRDHVSSINVTSLNERDTNPYPLAMMSPNTLSNNFALFPSVGFPASLSSTYTGLPPNMGFSPNTGLPYTATYGPMGQLFRNSDITSTSIRTHLDAMASSLASIPASTISASPYLSQQILQQYCSHPTVNLGTLELFTNSNPTNSHVTPVGATLAQSHSWSEQEPNRVPPYSEDTQKSVLKDGRNRVQEQISQNTDQVTTTEIMSPVSRNSTKKVSSVFHVEDNRYRVKDNTARKIGQISTVHDDDAGDNHLSIKTKKIHFSEDMKYGPPKKNMSNSAVQTDPDRNSSLPEDFTKPQSPLVKLESIPPPPPPPEAPGFHLKQPTLNEIHTRNFKSPPPVTLPKPASHSEPLPHCASSPVSTSHQNNISPSQGEPDLLNDNLLQTSLFAISNLTVMELPGSGVIHSSNFVKHRVDRFNGLADNVDQKCSITQITSPPSLHSPISGDPEADYDVYPRKSTNRSVPTNVHKDNLGILHEGYQRLVPPRNNHKSALSPLDRAHQVLLAKDELPPFTQESVSSVLSSEKFLTHEFRSITESADQHWMASTNLPQSLEPSSDLMSVTHLPKLSQPVFQSQPHLPKTSDAANATSLYQLPRKAKTAALYQLPREANTTSSHQLPREAKIASSYQQPREADTDSRDLPYQFYKGDPSLLTATTTRIARLSFAGSVSPDEAVAPVLNSAHYNRYEYGSDLSDTGYIFYKGPNLVSIVPEEVIISALDQAQHSPLGLEVNIEDPTGASTDQLNSCTQLEGGTPFHGSTKPEVPIPPRDFDSDADSSEYIYTSNGWSHIAKTPNTITAMFCAGVEDNSTRYMQLHLCSFIQEEQCPRTFFRGSLACDAVMPSVINKGIATLTQFGKRSHQTTSPQLMNWISETSLDQDQDPCVHKAQLIDVFNQHQRLPSPDLDSGISLTYHSSIDSFQDFCLIQRDELSLPEADYSSDCSSTTFSSMELGWDYLSCNESVREKETREDNCREACT